MRLRPHGTDSGALSRSRNRLVNPLDAPPHPQKSFYLTPRSTPMQYQVIILAFRYLLASFGRGAAARPRWFWTELVVEKARLRPSGLIDVFFATSKTRQKNARTWPTHTPFGSAPREESIAGVFAVLQGKRFFGPPAGALCLDYFSLKSLLRRHWVISNLYPTPYPIFNPRTSRIPPQSSTLALATDDGG